MEREGLVVGTVTFEVVEAASPDSGRILAQTPPANYETERGTLIDVVVGQMAGPPDDDTTTTTAPTTTTTAPADDGDPEDGTGQ